MPVSRFLLSARVLGGLEGQRDTLAAVCASTNLAIDPRDNVLAYTRRCSPRKRSDKMSKKL